MPIKALPPMEHTFTIKTEGSETGKIFEGTFTYKRPNLRTQSEIAKMKARLNEDLKNLDEDTAFLHGILSKLRHTLTNSPDWWKEEDFGYELYDVNVILDIYTECEKFEREWIEKVWGTEESDDSKKPTEK